jgi:hypothetical protein
MLVQKKMDVLSPKPLEIIEVSTLMFKITEGHRIKDTRSHIAGMTMLNLLELLSSRCHKKARIM